MISSIITCDNEDVTLGSFFLNCFNDAKDIVSSIPFPIIEVNTRHLNDLNISLKVGSLIDSDLLFIAYSHGGDDCLVVSGIDPYISTTTNHSIFGNSFFYTFSCSCGKHLGKTLIENGVKLFWGYDDVVHIIINHFDIFTECANVGLRHICQGATVSEAVKVVNEKYDEHIKNTYKKNMLVATTLMDNRDALTILAPNNANFDTLRLVD